MAAMAAFTFSSCEDVPEPYTLPTQPAGPGNTDPNQKGSESNPYTVAEAIAAIKAGTAPTTQVYLTGIISDVAFYNDQYKSITYYISDDGKSKDMQVYSGKGLNGADFASKEDLKVGQKVTILGKIMKFVDKNNKEIMEVDKTSSIVKIEGEGTGGGEVKPDPTPDTPASGNIEMTDASILSGKSGDVELVDKYYNSQNVTNESTWYTWKIGDTTFKGAKICISDGTNGKGIQMQGNASDASKQGFLFNSTAFAKDIKTVTILFSTKATSTYAPSYTLYAAKAANGKDTAIEGKSTNEVSGDYKTYTETFDLSAQNVKYFTLFNNKAGALYIEKIIITLK